MTRLSSSLDNRLTLKNFSLHQTKIPKTTLKEKLEKVLSSSLGNFKNQKSQNWTSKSVMPTPPINFKRKTSLNEDINRSPSLHQKLDHLVLKRSISVNVKSQSPTKLKFHQIQIQQEDLQYRRKEKKVERQLSSWKNRNNFLRSMIPAPEYVPPPLPPKIPKPPIQRQRINLLIQNLRVNIEYFWNIFQNIQKMTNLLKSLQGYNILVHSILFKNNEVTRISSEQVIQKYFQVFKQQQLRSQDYIQSDTKLYTALLFYNLKMQQKADTLQKQFMDKGHKGLQENVKMMEQQNLKVSRLTKQQNKYQTLQFLAQQRTFITNFRKGDAIKKLQQLGIKVSINQKIKDKVLADKQMLSSNYSQPLVKSVSPFIIHASKF